MEPYQLLERRWAEFNQLHPDGMVACSSGTAALHLALEALQLPPKSQVIVPDFTMIACPRAVTLAGLEPVFVDCDDRLLMDLTLTPRACVESTSAVMVVHIYGRCVDMTDVMHRRRLTSYYMPVIEDLAEAHGVRPHPLTDAACWSYYRNKIVAGEEGGAVWFKDKEHADHARQLRSLGFTDAHDFNHIPRGHNYRMSNAHAELIDDSLRMYPVNLTKRRMAEKVYDDLCPAEWRMPWRDAPWVYDLQIKELSWRMQDRVVKALNEVGIAARHGFKPIHIQPEYKDCRFVYGSDGHRSSFMSSWCIYLPLTPGTVTVESAKLAFQVIHDQLK